MDVETLGAAPRTQVEEFCRARAKIVQIEGSLSAVRVLGKYNLAVDTTDLSVALPIAMDGYWEMWITQFLIWQIQKGWNAIDVGASWGYYTLLLADLVGANGRVESWESNRDTHKTFSKFTLPLNGELAERIEASSSTAWCDESQLDLLVPSRENRGGARVSASAQGENSWRNQSVRGRRLDTTKLERVDFVKIDAEGAEYEIWKGMTGLFARGEPRAMFIEFTPSAYQDPLGFLNAMGLEGFRVSEISAESKLERFDPHEFVTRKRWVPLWLARDPA